MNAAKLLKGIVVLPVSHLTIAREWYSHTLGFEAVYLHTDPVENPEGNYAILRRDSAEVHLILDEGPHEHPWQIAGTGYLFLKVDGIDAIYEQAIQSKTRITCEIRREDWGERAFQLTDPSGNRIRVCEHRL
ncbi:glyoxalase superfamily protein [Schlesneria sp. T3-172]|uniref:glyoxalase superfamily protein n=1 Tax=Schlesneria sphaerica TaxID=3373610 RepID=UPI0037C6AD69